MNSSVVALLFVVACVTLSEGFSWKKTGQMSPLIPTDDEQAMCTSAADEMQEELTVVLKVPKQTCYVKCKYGNGEEDSLYSPKDTLCCDMVGVGPTGKCDGNGKCVLFMMDEDLE